MSCNRRRKEAVVFVLDVSPSMLQVYGADEGQSGGGGERHKEQRTKLQAAKEAIEGSMLDLMVCSKEHVCGVVVLATEATRHRFGEESFPNLTFYPVDGDLERPCIDLMKDLRSLQPAENFDDIHYGDLTDGVALATNYMERRTLGKQFLRRIVVLTDAVYQQIAEDGQEQWLQLIDKLRKIECKFHVIGLDFQESAEFDEGLSTEQTEASHDKSATGGSDGSDDDNDDDDDDDDDAEMSEDHDSVTVDEASGKLETEKFLISVARLTGGSVKAASTLSALLKETVGKRPINSTLKKVLFKVAPGLEIPIRVQLLNGRGNVPKTKTEALVFEDGKPMKDANGELVTSPIVTTTDHFEGVQPLSNDQMARAFQYGTDTVLVSEFDNLGMAGETEVCITILGYTEQSTIPRAYLMGPPRALTGADSERACGAISSLAQALHRKGWCAIATCVLSTMTGVPTLAALLPLEEAGRDAPYRLVMMTLPFSNDVKALGLPALDGVVTPNKEKARACDDLIDALMLPEDSLDSTKVVDPYIRGYWKTLVKRAMDPDCSEVVTARMDDAMMAPCEVLERAESALTSFHCQFPIVRVDKNGKTVKNKVSIWDLYDDDDGDGEPEEQ